METAITNQTKLITPKDLVIVTKLGARRGEDKSCQKLIDGAYDTIFHTVRIE